MLCAARGMFAHCSATGVMYWVVLGLMVVCVGFLLPHHGMRIRELLVALFGWRALCAACAGCYDCGGRQVN
jgi:hypothetical protein